MQFFGHALNLCIPDIDSVKEGEEEKDEKGRNDMEVDFSEEFLFGDGVYGFVGSGFLNVFGLNNFGFLADGKTAWVHGVAHVERSESFWPRY